ncbi:MAG: endonuclease III [Candidatus Sericytochromatia bacterium]
MTKAQINGFFATLAAANPDPKTELEYSSAYTLLVAVVLSAQATDVSVNKATRGLFAAADTPAKMVALGEEGIRDHIKTIGLFNAKAKNVLALSKALIANHGGEVPADRDALEALPGVGRKTANVVMNCAFGAETFAVDTHVFRVSNRTRLSPGKTVTAVEKGLEKRVPGPFRREAHNQLILLGRYASESALPPYLTPEALPVFGERLDRLTIVTGTLDEALAAAEPGQFSRFNLSNLFDWVDDAHLAAMLTTITRLSRDGGRLCYWNTLAPRPLPAVDGLHRERDLADALMAADRFPYAHFEVAAIRS